MNFLGINDTEKTQFCAMLYTKKWKGYARTGVFYIAVLSEAQRYGWSNCPLCDIILSETFRETD